MPINCLTAYIFIIAIKKNTEVGELLRLDPVSLSIKWIRLQWFGHVSHKDDADCLKPCTKMETEEMTEVTTEEDFVDLCQRGYGEFWPVL